MPEYLKAPEHELQHLTELPETGHGKIFLRLLREELQFEREAHERHPKISDDPITEDFRFKLGLIAGLKRALNMPDESLKFLQTRRNKV